MKETQESNGPLLEVGQVWSVGGRDIAIVRLGKHLGEYREYRDGKVIARGRAGLKAIREIQSELRRGGGKITARFEGSRRFL